MAGSVRGGMREESRPSVSSEDSAGRKMYSYRPTRSRGDVRESTPTNLGRREMSSLGITEMDLGKKRRKSSRE